MSLRKYLRRVYRTLVPWLYARTNYKLFLQTTFAELDRRIAAQMCASDVLATIIRPVPITAPFGNSMLVIAPHQDDEVIGCGGAMLLQSGAGKGVNVVFVQDGGSEHEEDGLSRDRLVEIREGEANRVASQLGISPPVFLRHAVLKPENIAPIAAEFRTQLDRIGADTVFAPFVLDPNHDHLMTTFALAEALDGCVSVSKVYGYEVWALCIANVVLNIDAVMEQKKHLLSYYQSQLSSTDYLHVTTGLNMYHSRTFGAGSCKYAERFLEMPTREYVELVREIRNKTVSA